MCAWGGESLPSLPLEWQKLHFHIRPGQHCQERQFGMLHALQCCRDCICHTPSVFCRLKCPSTNHLALSPGEQDIDGMCQQCFLTFNT